MKVVPLKKSKAELEADKEADGYAAPVGSPDNEGLSLRLEHHHLKKLGINGDMKSGHTFELQGRGTVEESESRSGKDGERHSARLRLTHAGVTHEGDEAEGRTGLKEDVAKAFEGSEKKRGAVVAGRDFKADKEIPEKKG
jgi:hypothetical protein